MNSVNGYICDIKEYFNYNSNGDINGYLKMLYDKSKINKSNTKSHMMKNK